MSDLIAIVYPSEQKAEEVRQRLFQLQKEYLIKISDAQNRIDSNPEFLNACLASPEKERAALVRARTASDLFRLHSAARPRLPALSA